MRRLKLYPIEEICFRVMMQLCGAHHQPHYAMEAMNEMNLMGMCPNAVTYGHYNKAVLESVWPEIKDASKALKLWQKLSLVIEVSYLTLIIYFGIQFFLKISVKYWAPANL